MLYLYIEGSFHAISSTLRPVGHGWQWNRSSATTAAQMPRLPVICLSMVLAPINDATEN